MNVEEHSSKWPRTPTGVADVIIPDLPILNRSSAEQAGHRTNAQQGIMKE